MKLTKRMNGQYMADFKITVALSLEGMATHFLSENLDVIHYADDALQSGQRMRRHISKLSAKDIKNSINDSIRFYGVETPAYRVGDNIRDEDTRLAMMKACEEVIAYKLKIKVQ